MDIRKNSRPKPWLAKKKSRTVRNLETGELVRPFQGFDSGGFYSSQQWRATSKAVLGRDAVCQWCLAVGIVRESECADHIVPRIRCASLGINVYDQSNIVGSCRSCNSKRAAYEARGYCMNTYKDWAEFLRKKKYGKE